jgi:hypothetical protein
MKVDLDERVQLLNERLQLLDESLQLLNENLHVLNVILLLLNVTCYFYVYLLIKFITFLNDCITSNVIFHCLHVSPITFKCQILLLRVILLLSNSIL